MKTQRKDIIGPEESVSEINIKKKNVILYDDPIEAQIERSLHRPSASTLVRLLIGILLVSSIFMFFAGVMEYKELHSERVRLEAEVEKLENEIDELKYLIDSPVDYDYIVRVARKKLGLYLPDEIIYYSDMP